MPGGQFLSLEGKLGGQTGDKIMKLTAKKQPTKKTSAKIASKINTWLSGVYEGIFCGCYDFLFLYFTFPRTIRNQLNISYLMYIWTTWKPDLKVRFFISLIIWYSVLFSPTFLLFSSIFLSPFLRLHFPMQIMNVIDSQSVKS